MDPFYWTYINVFAQGFGLVSVMVLFGVLMSWGRITNGQWLAIFGFEMVHLIGIWRASSQARKVIHYSSTFSDEIELVEGQAGSYKTQYTVIYYTDDRGEQHRFHYVKRMLVPKEHPVMILYDREWPSRYILYRDIDGLQLDGKGGFELTKWAYVSVALTVLAYVAVILCFLFLRVLF